MNEFSKRDFTQDEREELANRGAALPNGSFPIVTVEDLHNAISSYGRAKDQAAAKQHIIERARALDAVDQLPQTWNVETVKKKSTDLASALGITAEPHQLTQDHVANIEKIHDDVADSKKLQQEKNNYASSSHLANAQKHLMDAKATLEAKALNPDTKHILAKDALGKASKALTNATREAAGAHKNEIHEHNKAVRQLIANPPKPFSKDDGKVEKSASFALDDIAPNTQP